MKRFRGGRVFKAHIILHRSTLGVRVIKKKKKNPSKAALGDAVCVETFRTLEICLGGRHMLLFARNIARSRAPRLSMLPTRKGCTPVNVLWSDVFGVRPRVTWHLSEGTENVKLGGRSTRKSVHTLVRELLFPDSRSKTRHSNGFTQMVKGVDPMISVLMVKVLVKVMVKVKVGRNTVIDGGPVTVTGNGTNSCYRR